MRKIPGFFFSHPDYDLVASNLSIHVIDGVFSRDLNRLSILKLVAVFSLKLSISSSLFYHFSVLCFNWFVAQTNWTAGPSNLYPLVLCFASVLLSILLWVGSHYYEVVLQTPIIIKQLSDQAIQQISNYCLSLFLGLLLVTLGLIMLIRKLTINLVRNLPRSASALLVKVGLWWRDIMLYVGLAPVIPYIHTSLSSLWATF